MSRLVDALLTLSGAAAYTVVGLLAFGEAAAFVGLVLPGEAAILLGGVLASQGRVALPLMLVVASVAAIAGDSVGYEVGRVIGPRLLTREGFRRRFGAGVARAERYLAERGGRAVFLGRWTSVLRALVPGVAGMARMPYGRFFAYNVAGGVTWATVFTLAGYLAGASYRRVEQVVGRASGLLLAVLALALLLRWAVRRLAARRDLLRQWAERAAASPLGQMVTGGWGSQVAWVQDRLDPRLRSGLGMTALFGLLATAGWIAGAAVQNVLVHDELAALDAPVHRWVAAHTTAPATATAERITAALEPPWALPLGALLAVVCWWLGGPRRALLLIGAGGGGAALTLLLRSLLPTTGAGTDFPSGETAVAAAVTVAMTATIGERGGWRAGVRAATLLSLLVLVFGVAALVTGGTALSGVIGGAALGATWALSLEIANRVGPAEPP